jgi:ABC-2 type transport system permease protein
LPSARSGERDFPARGALRAFILVELIGETLQVTQSILNISPFNHVPNVLVSGVSVLPLVSLILVALILAIVGLVGCQRRSIG